MHPPTHPLPFTSIRPVLPKWLVRHLATRALSPPLPSSIPRSPLAVLWVCTQPIAPTRFGVVLCAGVCVVQVGGTLLRNAVKHLQAAASENPGLGAIATPRNPWKEEADGAAHSSGTPV